MYQREAAFLLFQHTRAEEADNYLRQMDYKKYAAVDRTALLEVLISRGMYQQAMSIVSQFGYEGIRIESQLKLTSRMLTRCRWRRMTNCLPLHRMYTDAENMMK